MDEDWQLSWQPLTQTRAFPQQGSLLELGCGAGNLSIYFARAGYTVTGVDIAPTAISWARENAAEAKADIHFILGDVLHLDEVKDETFDIALDGRCFHCIIGEDRIQFLKTARRVLKHHGILLLNTMCNEVPQSDYWQEHFDPQTRCVMHGDLATRYIGYSNDILQEIILAGFRILYVDVLPPSDKEELADLRVIAEKRE
jgi:ubiquinone/menaquinone biosynthesis C-methylase UbiE